MLAYDRRGPYLVPGIYLVEVQSLRTIIQSKYRPIWFWISDEDDMQRGYELVLTRSSVCCMLNYVRFSGR